MWGREMRAGLVFVIAALLVGQGFREWRRGHERSFRSIVEELEAREPAEARPVPSSPLPRREVVVGRIDPDHAGTAELTRLPGIGPALAGRIVAERDRSGPFRSAEGLLRVRGIGPKTLEKIRGFLSFSGDTSSIR